MAWQLVVSHTDYLLQLSALLRDPVYRGTHIPRGSGEPVLLIPGFFAGDWTLWTMAGWLNRLGYRAHFSGIDWNIDCPNRTAELLRWRLEHIQQADATPLIIIGHSLGGLLARFLGSTFPGSVRHVIALGSPVTRPLRIHPLVHSTFLLLQPLRRLKGRTAPQCGSVHCSCSFNRTVFSPLPAGVGFTSIFSKQDEVVDWRASLDPAGDNREVSGRHLGLIVNPQVYRLIAQVLSLYSQGRGRRETAAPATEPDKNGRETVTKQAF
ncbi:MAG: alpha/beta hydrolase [Candidatus Binatia bacterium]|nr:alpha/beta hydrolase [Candidatus Binatia bacterium]